VSSDQKYSFLHYGKDHGPFCSTLVSSYVSNTAIYCFSSRFVGAIVGITYMSLLYGTYVRDWEYQTSGPGSIEKSFFVSSTSSFLSLQVLLHFFMLRGVPKGVH
jgi:hypothetical protein